MNKLAVYALVAIMLAGCASDAKKPTLDSESIVVGRIHVIENGQSMAPYKSTSRPPMPYFYRAESDSTVQPRWKGRGEMLDANGDFVASFPAGTYIIYRITFDYSVIPKVAFQIPEPGNAYYIGTVELDLRTSHVLGRTRLDSVDGVKVADERERGEKIFSERESGFGRGLVNSIAVQGDALPTLEAVQGRKDLMDTLGTLGLGVLIIGQ